MNHNIDNQVYKSLNGKQFQFNAVVKCITLSMMRGSDVVGRLVQVRKGCGQFGSDVILLRMPDGNLGSFENELIEASNVAVSIGSDSSGVEYTIQNKWPETGFIVEKPCQPETSGSFVIAQSHLSIKVSLQV